MKLAHDTFDTETAADIVQLASTCMANGGVVVIPTDTVYGLAASVDHPAAIERLFRLKQRPDDKPIPLLLSSVDALKQFEVVLSSRMRSFLKEFWPGPLTGVFPAQGNLLSGIAGPGNSIGARFPDHALALQVIEHTGGVIACTSANLSGSPPATALADLSAEMRSAVDMVVDGGGTAGQIASTVVAFEGENIAILREGPIEVATITKIWQKSR